MNLGYSYNSGLQVTVGSNIVPPSHRVPAGFYISASTHRGQWSTGVKAVAADNSVRWDESLAIQARPLSFPRCFMRFFPSSSKVVHLEVRASFETARLGQGELIGRVQTTLKELFANNGAFEIPLVDATPISSLPPSAHLVDHGATKPSDIDLLTDTAHKVYALYRNNNHRKDLDNAVNGFEEVLRLCPVGHPQRAAALSNLAHSILYGFTKGAQTDIDYVISLFHSALTLRPPGDPDHPLSIHDLCKAFYERYSHFRDHADLREVVRLYLELLPICPERSYLQLCAIEECIALPGNPSDESISLGRMVVHLCPQGHQYHAHSLSKLAENLKLRFDHCRSPNDINECISLNRKVLSLHPPSHLGRASLNNLAKALRARYDQYRKTADLEEADRLEQSAWNLSAKSSMTLAPIHEERPKPRPHEKLPSRKPTRSRARNVVIFGQTGSGKSSVINAILRDQQAQTSNNAPGCTSCTREYEVDLDGKKFILFDTVGLDEGSEGTVPTTKAEKDLQTFLHYLMRPQSGGISLLVYCVRTVRVNHALVKNYRLVSTICGKKIPIVVVVTGLEDYPSPTETWWEKNGERFHKLGMHFKDHACVTTLREDSDESVSVTQRISESSVALRHLILNNCAGVGD